jgi:dynein heavy chain
MVDDAIVGEWNLQSLPTDALSVQNGLITTSANRWPILIDPQGYLPLLRLVLEFVLILYRQGLSWILKREKQNGLVVTRADDKYFLQQLEDCLTNGKPMLMELTEEVDPILDPLLDKQFIKSGRSYKIVISDKEMDYNESFRVPPHKCSLP